MLGAENMSTREANIALLSTIPEEVQQQNFCDGNPLEPKSAEDIYAELEASRACFNRGEYEDFDDALDEISKKYDL